MVWISQLIVLVLIAYSSLSFCWTFQIVAKTKFLCFVSGLYTSTTQFWWSWFNLHTIIRVCEHQTTLELVLIGFLFQLGLNLEPAFGLLSGMLACAMIWVILKQDSSQILRHTPGYRVPAFNPLSISIFTADVIGMSVHLWVEASLIDAHAMYVSYVNILLLVDVVGCWNCMMLAMKSSQVFLPETGQRSCRTR